MKTWRIPITWEECGIVKVQANTLEEAIDKAMYDNDDIPLPKGSYVEASWQVSDEDEDFIRECYNNGQEDEEEE